MAIFNKIYKLAQYGSEEITSMLNLLKLLINICISVNDCKADPRMICKLAGLIVDLRGKLIDRSKDKNSEISFA